MGNAVESVHSPVPRVVSNASLQCLQLRDVPADPKCNPEASCGHGRKNISEDERRDPEELGKRGTERRGEKDGHLPERAEETLQQPGKGETVTSGRGTNGWTTSRDGKETKGAAWRARGRDEFKESYEEGGKGGKRKTRARERRQ